MKVDINKKKIDEVLTKGVESIIDEKSIRQKLFAGKPLRVKHGIDPTGPRIHLGRAAQFWKLRAFQELGHQVVLIIGDFTAQIGDASDKLTMRKALSEVEIKENMKDYEKQMSKILDMQKVELRYNSEWLGKLRIKDFLKLAMKFTAQQVIQRRNFKERWESKTPIGLHELSYPLFQGYDSVAVRADIEIGGTDQLFNLQAGREIQQGFGQAPQDLVILEMLPGLDGRKMSTSWGNFVTIVDDPNDMYGKIMSLDDKFILIYFELCTLRSPDAVKKIERQLNEKKINPRDIKIELAKEIVTLYHGQKAARQAEKEFTQIFQKKQLPSELPISQIRETELPILDLLVRIKLAPSRSEAKRLVLQRGVKIDEEVQTDWQKTVAIKKGMVVRVGKRKFVQVQQ